MIKKLLDEAIGELDELINLTMQDIANIKEAKHSSVDERTGTIVSGINAVVSPVVITHGAITIKIEPNSYEEAAQNDVNIGSDTSVAPSQNLLKISGEKTTVANVTRALNKLGATPSDIISILENLKRVGAIQVDLEII